MGQANLPAAAAGTPAVTAEVEALAQPTAAESSSHLDHIRETPRYVKM